MKTKNQFCLTRLFKVYLCFYKSSVALIILKLSQYLKNVSTNAFNFLRFDMKYQILF